MGLRQIFAVRSIPLYEIRNRIEAKSIYPHLQPEAHDVLHRLEYLRIIKVQIRLMAEEAMPEELLRHRIPRPVRRLGVREDDPRAGVLVRIVAPHVPGALSRTLWRSARSLEP